jgi:formylglycine-generating enzyme required for sulfatase activity
MSSAFCTVGYAANWPPYSRFNDGGFRVARNAERFATVWGGTLPQSSPNAGEVVETFQIARFEVTRAEWDAVRAWAVANGYGDLGNVGSGADGNHPVRKVGWYDAVKWCNAKSEMEGLAPVYQLPGGGVYRTGQVSPVANGAANGYRLPTRVEWEWAARGGLSSRGFTYSGGNNLDAVGWYFSNTNDLTEPVGAKVPNELGLYDMSGNVWEWVFEASGTNRLLRGGSFAMEDEFCGVGYLANWSPDARYNDGGFRLARKLDELVSD